MSLVVIGGYYEKEKALEILRNLKYYNSSFEELESNEDIITRVGLFPFLGSISDDKIHEDFLCDKMRVVKSVLLKSGDDAIDEWETLTSPNNSHFLQPIKKMMPEENWLHDILDELSIPMKKDEFEHYLDIYNSIHPKP